MALRFKMETKGGDEWLAQVNRYGPETRRAFECWMRRLVTKWELEAKRRSPVEFGVNRNSILGEVSYEGGILTGAVGTNTDYGVEIEFGTDFIAGGAVKALGTDPHVTDDEAIHWWPAKAETAVTGTSASRAGGKLYNSGGLGLVSQNAQEQMPWLRPAFWAILPWAQADLEKSLPK